MPDRKNPNKPPHRAQSLRHLSGSVERTKRILARWPNTAHVDMSELAKELSQAQALLNSVAKKLDALPPNYPPRRIAATALIQPGATVMVKEQYRDKYKALIPTAELDELFVQDVNEHSLTFKTKSGLISLAPKRHVKAVEALIQVPNGFRPAIDVAQEKEMTPSTLYRWIDSGKVKGCRIAGRRYVNVESLEKYLQPVME